MSLLSFVFASTLIRTILIGLPMNQSVQTDPLPMLIYFSADHCPRCTQFDELFQQAELLQKLEQHYVTVRVSIDEKVGKACADIYAVQNTPAIIVADYKGQILYKSDENLSIQEVTAMLGTLPGQHSSPESAAILTSDTHLNPQTEGSMLTEGNEKSMSPTDVTIGQQQTNELNQLADLENHDPVTRHSEGSIAQKTKVDEAPALKKNSASTSHSVPAKKVVQKTDRPNMTVPPKTKFVASGSPASNLNTGKAAPIRTSRTYAIQLGYFSMAPNAKTLQLKAQGKGLSETRTDIETHDGKSFYRVLVGKCATLAEAQSLLSRVNALGLKGAVYRQ